MLRPTAIVLLATVLMPAGLFAQQQSASPPPQRGNPPAQLPVDLTKIREALKQEPALRLTTDELRFYVNIIGRIPTFEEIVGDFDLRKGRVPGAGMTHDEFLAMVTPKDLHSSTGISAIESLSYALTSAGLLSLVRKSYAEYKKATTDRERRAIQAQIERELRELERRRGGGLAPDFAAR